MSGPAIWNNYPSPVVGKTDKQSLNVQRLTTWACGINWGQSNINLMLLWPQLFLSQSVIAAHVDVDLMKVIALQLKKIAIIFVNRRWANFWILNVKPRADHVWRRREMIKIGMQNRIVSRKQALEHFRNFGIAAFERALISSDGKCCVMCEKRQRCWQVFVIDCSEIFFNELF